MKLNNHNTTHSQILSNALQLIARVVVVLLLNPFFFDVSQRETQYFDWAHVARFGRLGEAQKRLFDVATRTFDVHTGPVEL